MTIKNSDERCKFCGLRKDGVNKFISGTTGALVCFNCIKHLKEVWDDIQTMKMGKDKPDDSMRCD